ncbi:hypothetical protein DPMN_018045 [Dreissena polymorpha]|uniref:Uncharacterized protein n=1 Tax=Dreissena polymorpha TaxID=45954 RepID=A0A9D4S811_DREPO|nr:hypothetical protein DPMN_018045 [Dreissena polymorpha]
MLLRRLDSVVECHCFMLLRKLDRVVDCHCCMLLRRFGRVVAVCRKPLRCFCFLCSVICSLSSLSCCESIVTSCVVETS